MKKTRLSACCDVRCWPTALSRLFYRVNRSDSRTVCSPGENRSAFRRSRHVQMRVSAVFAQFSLQHAPAVEYAMNFLNIQQKTISPFPCLNRCSGRKSVTPGLSRACAARCDIVFNLCGLRIAVIDAAPSVAYPRSYVALHGCTRIDTSYSAEHREPPIDVVCMTELLDINKAKIIIATVRYSSV